MTGAVMIHNPGPPALEDESSVGREFSADELAERLELPDWVLDLEQGPGWAPGWAPGGGRRGDFMRAVEWALGKARTCGGPHWSHLVDVMEAKEAAHKVGPYRRSDGHVPMVSDLIARRGRAVPFAAWCHIPSASGGRAHAWVGWDGRVLRLCGPRPTRPAPTTRWAVTDAVIVDDPDKARAVLGLVGSSGGPGYKPLRLGDLR